jgi:hypothetical protein
MGRRQEKARWGASKRRCADGHGSSRGPRAVVPSRAPVSLLCSEPVIADIGYSSQRGISFVCPVPRSSPCTHNGNSWPQPTDLDQAADERIDAWPWYEFCRHVIGCGATQCAKPSSSAQAFTQCGTAFDAYVDCVWGMTGCDPMVECEEETLAVDACGVGCAVSNSKRVCTYYVNYDRYECPPLSGCSWSEGDGDVCPEGRYTRSACGVGEIL